MTDSGQNVFATASAQQGRKRSHLLGAGRDGADGQRSVPEKAVLFGRVERFGPGAMSEKRGGVQRSGRSTATVTVSFARRAAGR